MDASFSIVENATDIEYSSLSADTIDTTKRFILDTIGAIIAGSSATGVKELLEQLIDWGGKKESTILIYGKKMPAPHAALINGLMAHARELDDIHDDAHVHSNITIFPATLAIAEAEGRVSGKEFITAVALGTDLVCRMGLATQNDTGWHWSTTYGSFGSALAAGKILKLNSKALHNALGIAYSMMGGTLQNLIDGALMKRIQPGFAAKAGIISACLARKGVSGSTGLFEGKYGYFNLYERGNYDREELTGDLGKRFEGTQTSIKRYPCCRCNHASIDAMLTMIKGKDIKPGDIREIEVIVPEHVVKIVGKPFEIRSNPQIDGQFSLQYTVGAALARKNISLQDFEEEAVRDPAVMGLTKKIKITVDHEIKGRPLVPSTIKVELNNGEIITERIDVMKGQPENPLDREELLQKVRDLLPYSALPIDKARFEKIVNVAENLEQLDDISVLTNLLNCEN